MHNTSTCIYDSKFWKHEEDMITYLFQPPKSESLHHPHDDAHPFPGEFGTCSFEHLDLFYEEDIQPPICSNFDEYDTMIFPG
jgi:hypothetical protein